MTSELWLERVAWLIFRIAPSSHNPFLPNGLPQPVPLTPSLPPSAARILDAWQQPRPFSRLAARNALQHGVLAACPGREGPVLSAVEGLFPAPPVHDSDSTKKIEKAPVQKPRIKVSPPQRNQTPGSKEHGQLDIWFPYRLD